MGRTGDKKNKKQSAEQSPNRTNRIRKKELRHNLIWQGFYSLSLHTSCYA